MARTDIIGIGLGDRFSSINPQTLAVPNAADVIALKAQVAGRMRGGILSASSTTFTTPVESVTVTSPTSQTLYAWTFESALAPAASVQSMINGDRVSGFHTPRALVLYPTMKTAAEYVDVTKTMNGYVYQGRGIYSYAETLSFAPATAAVTLRVTVAIADNDDDNRPLVIQAEAGGVTASQTMLAPDHGKNLNIVTLELPQVPAGTTQVIVTLGSPAKTGDSGVLMGINASYACTPTP
jgi:hypothetical protein